jgi:hypothetical protein
MRRDRANREKRPVYDGPFCALVGPPDAIVLASLSLATEFQIETPSLEL